MDAAEALLDEQSVDKLSLRAAARRTGVSQAAPYAHFENRQALLAAVGTRGFRRLCDYLRDADQPGADGADRMRYLARAYIAFAMNHPMLFRLMFGSELCDVDYDALRAAGQASYDYIRSVVAERVATQNVDTSVDDASLAAWAMVHGLATLIVDGKQPWPATSPERDALVDRVVSLYSILPEQVDT